MILGLMLYGLEPSFVISSHGGETGVSGTKYCDFGPSVVEPTQTEVMESPSVDVVESFWLRKGMRPCRQCWEEFEVPLSEPQDLPRSVPLDQSLFSWIEGMCPQMLAVNFNILFAG